MSTDNNTNSEQQINNANDTKFNNLIKSAVDFEQFQENNNNVDNVIFENLLYRGQTMLIKSDKSIGSTWLMIEIARALSFKDKLVDFFQYQSSTKGINDITLSFMADIPLKNLNKRMYLIKNEAAPLNNNLHIFSKEDHLNNNKDGQLDLTKSDWMDNIIIAADDVKNQHLILLFDSLDTLVKSEQIASFSEKIEALHRNPNITQIWVDKGRSKNLFPVHCIDTQLRLKSPKNRGNVAIEVSFEKANALPKDWTRPFIIELKECERGAKMKFERLSSEIDNENTAVVMMIEGKTQTDIAKSLKVSQAAVSNWRAIAASKGLIEIRGHNNIPTAQGDKLVKSMKLYM